jgi:hypothetical protein
LTRVRIYLPTTMSTLPLLLNERAVPGGPATAVTPALREWNATDNEDELEYAALLRAARQSLLLLADDVTAPRRRVVLAADVAEARVRPAVNNPAVEADQGEQAQSAAVFVEGALPLSAIQAVHIDDASTTPLVRAALIEPDDEQVQADLEDVDLLWYATQEIGDLLAP